MNISAWLAVTAFTYTGKQSSLNSALCLCNFSAMFMAVSAVTSDLLQCNWGKSLTQFVCIYGRKPRKQHLFLFKVQEESQCCWRKACKPRLQPAALLLWHTILRMFLKCLKFGTLPTVPGGPRHAKAFMVNDFSIQLRPRGTSGETGWRRRDSIWESETIKAVPCSPSPWTASDHAEARKVQ